MSCCLCGNRTLSLVTDVVKSEEFKEYDEKGWGEKTTHEIMCKLAQMNSWSLDCRYGLSEDNHLDEIKYIPMEVSPAQRHMSVCSYRYQTCEGLGNKEDPLYKALSKWADENDDKYRPEHDNCSWFL